jgi:hypothetical protein
LLSDPRTGIVYAAIPLGDCEHIEPLLIPINYAKITRKNREVSNVEEAMRTTVLCIFAVLLRGEFLHVQLLAFSLVAGKLQQSGVVPLTLCSVRFGSSDWVKLSVQHAHCVAFKPEARVSIRRRG